MVAKGFLPIIYLRKSADLDVATKAFEAAATSKLAPRPTHLSDAPADSSDHDPEHVAPEDPGEQARADVDARGALAGGEDPATTNASGAEVRAATEPMSVRERAADPDALPPVEPLPRTNIMLAPVRWARAGLRRWVYRNFSRRIVAEIDANADHRLMRLLAFIAAQDAKAEERAERSSQAVDDLIRETAATLLARTEQAERTITSQVSNLRDVTQLVLGQIEGRLEEITRRLDTLEGAEGRLIQEFTGRSETMRVTLNRDLGLKVFAEAKWLEARLGEQIVVPARDLAQRMDVISERLDIVQAETAPQLAAVSLSLREAIGEARDAVIAAGGSVGVAIPTDLTEALDRIETYAVKAARRGTTSCGPWVLVRSAVGYVLCPSDDAALIATLVDSGEMEPGTRVVIERLLQAGQCFVDVGANIGLHTIAAARRVGPTGTVFAFEASPNTSLALDESLWVNGLNKWVRTEQVGVFSAAGEQELFLGRTSGHHSLYSDVVEQGSGRSITVRTETLDRLVPRGQTVDLIKIDVEGAELEVLAGARQLLSANADASIIIEFGLEHLEHRSISPDQWFAQLRQFGVRRLAAVDEQTGALSAIEPAEVVARGNVNLVLERGETRFAELGDR